MAVPEFPSAFGSRAAERSQVDLAGGAFGVEPLRSALLLTLIWYILVLYIEDASVAATAAG